GRERGVILDGAVAIGARDLDGIARLAVELAVAVRILLEVAVNAVHALFEVDVFQVDSLGEFLWIGSRNDAAILVEQISLAVALEHRAENPAVAVKVGELGVLQILVELGGADAL